MRYVDEFRDPMIAHRLLAGLPGDVELARKTNHKSGRGCNGSSLALVNLLRALPLPETAAEA